MSPLIPPSGVQKLRIQLKIQSVRLKRRVKTSRFRDAVFIVCDLPVAHGKLLDTKTVRFCGKVFLDHLKGGPKIEIFF